MDISSLISTVNEVVDKTRVALQKIPGLLLLATASRRPGFSSILTSAKVYADMTYVQQDNDEVVKEFTYNLIDHIKQNIQDDSVCFVAIPPNELMVNLNGANAGGPVVLVGSNINYVFVWAIIR